MHRTIAFLLPAIVLAASAPASAIPVVEDNAIVNGEFEVAAHPARTATCPVFGNTYVNVFDPANPYGLPWLAAIAPCHQSAVTAAQWSHGAGALYEDFDGDGDREARILPGVVDPQMGSHNMWQSYANPQQAFTAGFQSLQFRVEQGSVPAGAAVVLSLSETPISDASPWVVLFLDCSLTFRVSDFTVAGGLWSVDPTEGRFSSRASSCANEAAAWSAAANAEERRAVLSELRLVQTSFWSFNTGSAPVTLDGVAILGAPTAVEALVAANAP